MPQCEYHNICGRDVEGNPAHGLCILHSTDAAKDARAFDEALALHRKCKGDNFSRFVFPGKVDFNSTGFTGDVDFTMATFTGQAGANNARFAGRANFLAATFHGDVDFNGARFTGCANFDNASFSRRADFIGARFAEANFSLATFTGGANFTGARFAKKANFFRTTFLGRTLFSARGETIQPAPAEAIFSGIEVDFRNVVIQVPGAMTFVEADLTKCLFEDTDLRTVQMVGIQWPKKGPAACGL